MRKTIGRLWCRLGFHLPEYAAIGGDTLTMCSREGCAWIRTHRGLRP